MSIASQAMVSPMDNAMRVVLRETLVFLTAGRETANPLVRRLRLEQMSVEKLLEEEMGTPLFEVFRRPRRRRPHDAAGVEAQLDRLLS